jgi:hypothetical protein
LQPNLPTAVATGAAIGSLRTLKKAKGTLVLLGYFFGNNIIDGIGRCGFETPPSQTPLYCLIRHGGIRVWNRYRALDCYSPINGCVASIHHFPPTTLDLVVPTVERLGVNTCVLIPDPFCNTDRTFKQQTLALRIRIQREVNAHRLGADEIEVIVLFACF